MSSMVQVTGRIVGVFAILGTTLAAATLMLLAESGAFSGDGMGAMFAMGFTLMIVMVFALLVGLVVAAIGGAHAARILPDGRSAALAGGIGGAAGHLALVVALGLVLGVGLAILVPAPENESTMPVEPEESSGFDWGSVAKLAWGIIPAGVTGAGTGALLFQRPAPRRLTPEPAPLVAQA